MADLTHKDVEQAVQTAIRNMESNIQRLTTEMSSLSNQMQVLSQMAKDLQTMRMNLQQNMGTTGDPVSFQSAPNMGQLEDTIKTIQSDVQSLKNNPSN